ncbi:MAG: von Willebrand factor type A domain-containing protein [Akkermansiaceae bacterium]|nr:von Willebrand factor type A domain-containing protein [Akkermansiaceae bacterium]
MNSSTDPSDRLLDSLLHEQHRDAADEALLADIEKAIAATPAQPEKPVTPATRTAKPRRRSRMVPFAIAAAVTIGVGSMLWWNPQTRAALGLNANRADMERLKLEYPPELIEGTPRPIILPGTTPQPRPAPTPMPTPPAPTAPVASLIPPTEEKPDPYSSPALPGNGLPPANTRVADAKAELEKINQVRGTIDEMATSPLRQRAAELREIIEQGEQTPASPPPTTGFNRDQYGRLTDQPWKSPWQDALSTFSVDVDAASYTNVRNMILSGRNVPTDAVRIEELVNYFDYRYAPPTDGRAFALRGTLATCPWQPSHLLARITIKGREIANNARPASNLVFLIDVSGSMQDVRKLPLLRQSLLGLLQQLDERDHLGIVVYAGSEGVVLPPTELNREGIARAVSSLEQLHAGGSTNGGAGLKLAYAMAAQNLRQGAVNRVILATDGDFNVGVTGQGELVSLVKAEAAKGISLTVLGFGSGNLNDSMMEAISNDGNGNYFYIDQQAEAKRIFQQKLTGTLVTIAKDVKIQVEFNPGKVKAYRLIGYANRILRHQDFNNDKVDAGDIGAGHTVTAFYEIVPQGVAAPDTGTIDDLRYQRPANREAVTSEEWFTLKLRHKHPEGDISTKIETVMTGAPQPWEQADTDFRFASAVALFGMKLRQLPDVADISWNQVAEFARPGLADDPQEQRAGFVELLRKIR